MVYNIFNVLLNNICKNIFENVCVCVHQVNWSKFFVVSLSCFDIKMKLASQNEFGRIPFVFKTTKVKEHWC
jgi:hypothetical protein